jgi:hypothetical protein
MPNPNHVFSLHDLFYANFPYKSMQKFLDGYRTTSMPLRRQVTMGDVALVLGANDAYWCIRLLSEEARRDIIRSVIPSVRRAVLKEEPVDEKHIEALLIIENFTNQKAKSAYDTRTAYARLATHPRNRSAGAVVSHLANATYSTEYVKCIQQARITLDIIGHLDEKELDQQINEICAIFPPIAPVRAVVST